LCLEVALLIFSLGSLAAIIVAAITSGSPSKKPNESDPPAGAYAAPRQQNIPNGPAADFAALINTILDEGGRNRAEQKSEDRGKRFRDYLTLGVLGPTLLALSVTCCAIIQQVDEMRKVYPDIHSQSTTTSGQLDILKQEGQAMVGPIGIALVNTNSADEPLKARLVYRNFGRQPATRFYVVSTLRLPLLGHAAQTDIFGLPFWKDKAQFNPESDCGAEQYKVGEITVYPSDLAFTIDVAIRNGYPATSDNTPTGTVVATGAVLNAVTSKNELYVIYGCFTYNTFDETAFSMWCAMLVPADGNDISKWPFVFCPFGNETKVKKK
jgi:hypothetical protein